MMELVQKGEFDQLKLGADNINAEAKGESALQRNWRPLTMLIFVTIIANNYLIYPYLSLFWHAAPQLPIPPQMFNLLDLGLTGYIVGRSGEKMVKAWADKK